MGGGILTFFSELKTTFPEHTVLNSQKNKDLAWNKSKKYFIFVDRCISSAQMDQKHAPDPMRWVPGADICMECQIW